MTISEHDDRKSFTTWPVVVLALWAFALLLAPEARAEESDGKSIFLESGCNKCHSLEAEGIAVIQGEDEDEDEEDDPFGSDEEEAEPEDLSGIGNIWKDGEEGLQKWLTKKLERDGKLHKKKFPGSGKELKTLASWLMSLKEPAPAE